MTGVNNKTIAVFVNGEPCEATSGSTLEKLIATLGFGDQRIATEVNLKVIPRADYGSLMLSEGDRIEIVSFVGGG